MKPTLPAKRSPASLRPAALVAALCVALGAGPTVVTAAEAGSPVPAARGRGQVTLNFVNAEIDAVTRAIGAMIGRQFVVDPRVRGQLTVFSEQPQTVAEAYQSYLAALRGLGFAVVESGGLLKVVPEADAKLQAGTVSLGEVAVKGDQVITQVFSLRHETANNLVAVLRPLISANNTINASPATNSLVITDYAENLQRLGKIISALDQPASTDMEIIPLQHAVASDIATLVQRMADGGPGTAANVPGAPGATAVVADPRSNSLIVKAASPTRLSAVRAAVARLDRPAPGVGPTGGMWVVHLKNADAVRLATVIRAAFAAIGTTSTGGAPVGATGQPLQAPAAAAPVSAGTTSSTGTGASAVPIGTVAQPSVGGFIQADPATNSLIITAPEPLYRQVRAMIDQLDTRRAQVYIESMIVEVSGNDAADVGFQWLGLLSRNGDPLLAGVQNLPGTGTGIIDINTSAASGTVTLGQGLNIGLLRQINGVTTLSAIARLLQSNTNSNIISTPNLITLDNEEAKIVVGSNVPFVTGQYTNTGTGGVQSPFQTIERKDVGITLRIKPQIGESGTIRMQIFQESSSVSEKVAPGTSNAGPSTDKRLIESNVVVDDGGILVLGGLIQDRFTENKSKVPLLGDIPGIGALFRSESRTKERTNLMVFIRPKVLRDAASADQLSTDRYEMIRSQQSVQQPAPSVVMPINSAPVLPPLGAAAGQAPAAATPAPVTRTP